MSRTRHAVCALVAVLATSTVSLSAHALVIVPTFGVGVSASAQAAFNFAAGEFQAAFYDPVTVNIAVQAGNTGLGGSLTNLVGFLSYSHVRADLIADQTAAPSANGAISVNTGGSVSTTVDPTNGGKFLYSTAQAKALGEWDANAPGLDGTFTYNSTLAYTFDPSNRGSGGYDFIGVAEHEISEIMGRIPGLGTNFCNPPCGPDYFIYDLFRYTGAGVRGMSDGAGRYFSINNGSTNLHGYNFANGNQSDPQDWDASVPTDPFNAFTGVNQFHAMNATDLATLDVIGWNLVPEPATLAMMLAGLGALAAMTRRRALTEKGVSAQVAGSTAVP